MARNRKARRDYFVDDTFEAGIVLSGTEVKSLRQGHGSINESYAVERNGELYLVDSHIPEYAAGGVFNHLPKRDRKLLMHRREIARMIGATQRQGMTLVPLTLFFNDRGIAKVELALARGKQNIDKRQTVKDRDWQRQKARLMREKG